MKLAIQRRSQRRHLIHPDGLATYCGRILYRKNWKFPVSGRKCECSVCLRGMEAGRKGTGK